MLQPVFRVLFICPVCQFRFTLQHPMADLYLQLRSHPGSATFRGGKADPCVGKKFIANLVKP